MNYINEIKKALRNIADNTNLEINEDSKILEDLGFESIDFVDFVFELEKLINNPIDLTHMSVTISEISGKRLKDITVSDISHYLTNMGSK